MYNRNDPRFRRTLNQITQNLESANESAQVGLFSITEHYIKPCFTSIKTCIEPCTDTLFPRDDHTRARRRGRTWSRGRAELNFDFYDDWEEDENDALLALGNDELERLLGETSPQESTAQQQQPGRRRVMSYGSRSSNNNEPRSPVVGRPPRNFEGADPTVIPNQSYFGFLSRLPFKIGGKGLRYKPSAEGLQDRAKAEAKGKKRGGTGNGDSDGESDGDANVRVHRRKRSATQSSGHTTDSFSSRGDIFPSDEEDAVPLDDDLTGVLERRTTHDDSSGRTKKSKHESPSTQSLSSRSSRQKGTRKSSASTQKSEEAEPQMGEMATLQALKIEERRIQAEEESEIEKRRDAAQKLAVERGLVADANDDKSEEMLTSPMSPAAETPSPDTEASRAADDEVVEEPAVDSRTTAHVDADPAPDESTPAEEESNG